MFDPFKTRHFGCTQPHNAPFWAILIGETYASAVHARRSRRPHPGMLPDVDFSRQRTDGARQVSTGSQDDPVEDMRLAVAMAA